MNSKQQVVDWRKLVSEPTNLPSWLNAKQGKITRKYRIATITAKPTKIGDTLLLVYDCDELVAFTRRIEQVRVLNSAVRIVHMPISGGLRAYVTGMETTKEHIARLQEAILYRKQAAAAAGIDQDRDREQQQEYAQEIKELHKALRAAKKKPPRKKKGTK